MKKFKKTILIFSLLLLSCFAHAQNDSTKNMLRKNPPKQNFRDRIFTGGNLGLQFGTITIVNVSPILGYRITEKLHAGIGATYLYYRDNQINLETNVYGGSLFGRYFIFENLFAQAEYEYLNIEVFDFQRRRMDITSILGGAGYYQAFSERSGVTAIILYNFTETVYTPYGNPIFRIGFNLGF